MQFTPISNLTDGQKARYMQLPIDLFAYDDGYYGKKIVSGKVPQGTFLRTLMGTTTRPMSTSSSLLGGGLTEGVEYKTTSDGTMRYLFGRHADQQLQKLTTKSTDNVTVGNIKLQQFFAAALVKAFPTPGSYHLRGAVMLPVDAFSTPQFKDRIRETLCGLYTLAALTGYKDGEPVYEPYEFFVEKIIPMEQPLGSLFRVLYDPAQTVDANSLMRQRKSFLDWGAGTLDIFTVDFLGGKLTRVDNMCGSSQAGINVLFDYVRNAVFSRHELNPSPMDLEAAIMAGQYTLNVPKALWPSIANEKGVIDLKPYIQQGVQVMWDAALQLFDETIGLTAETINAIFITGGPSGWMQPLVLEHFGEHRVFKVELDPVDPDVPYRHLMDSKDLHLRNVLGGYAHIKSVS